MTINQQVNKNITKEEYFNDKHVIEVKDLNIKVEVYSHDLRASKVAKIESEIRETATNFKDAFKLERIRSEVWFKKQQLAGFEKGLIPYNAPHKLDQKKMVDPSRKVKG